jgi:hypothetical protein
MKKSGWLWAIGGIILGTAIIYGGRNMFDRKKLIQAALDELRAWANGQIKETEPGIIERLRAYWHSAGVTGWTEARMRTEAWSAAFISFLMKQAGAGSNFKYSASHSVFIREAVKNRKANNSNPFKAYKPSEVKIEVGDLVGFPRQSGVTYDTTTAYAAHTDVVVAIKGGFAETVGGNVSNSVSRTLVNLDKDGKIDLSKNDKRYFVVIKTK